MSSSPVSGFWFRRDLRIDDNHGLYHALKDAGPRLVPIFIFDENILSPLPRADHRVSFIHDVVSNLKYEFSGSGLDLHVFHGRPLDVFKKLIKQHKISRVFCNDDYEPYALIFAKDEITKDDGTCYRMFTPYYRKWLQAFRGVEKYATKKHLPKGRPARGSRMPSLKDLGFVESELKASSPKVVWREFFQKILFHYPKTVDQPFDERFRRFAWRSVDAKRGHEDFEAWKDGRTGFPIVDAGMRELKSTGYMHNRARMIAGSFLTKHLLLNWQLGERHFAELLFDFELASNVGNWQWVAGTGCDAAPYFRVFNPIVQAKKFDPDGDYVRKWVPELGSRSYPELIVDHESARRRALTAYAKLRGGTK